MERKNLLLFLLVGIFMIIPLVSAIWWNPFTWFDDDTNSVMQKDGKWILKYTHGIQEEYFDTIIENLDNGKAKICLSPKTNLSINNPIIQQSKAILKNNNIETRVVQPSDMELETEGGNIKKMCVDVDYLNEDYIKFGEYSTVITYETEILEVTDTDDNVIGNIVLTTDNWYYKNDKPHVDYGYGNYEIVHEFKINKIQNYSNIFDNVYFRDMNTNEQVQRDFNLKYLIYKERVVNDYEEQLIYSDVNGTEIYDNIIIGNHTEIIKVWKNLTEEILNTNTIITVGVETMVYRNDYLDVGFDFAGVDVGVFWSSWSGDWNTGNLIYLELEESSGDAIDSTGNNYDFAVAAAVTRDATGFIGNCYRFSRSSLEDLTLDIGTIISSPDTFTITTWVRQNFTLTSPANWGVWGMGNSPRTYYQTDVQYWQFEGSIISEPRGTFDNEWLFLVSRWDGSTNTLWIYDETELIFTNSTIVAPVYSSSIMNIGSYGSSSREWKGDIDEWSLWNRALSNTEIDDLHENYILGCGYDDDSCSGSPPSVTLTSPVNNANLTSATVDHIATITDAIYVENVTLYLDGVANETKTTHVNGSYTFTPSPVSEGVHTWSILAWNNQSLSNQSSNWTYNYTQPPIYIDLLSPADSSTSNIPLVNVTCIAYKNEGVLQLNMTINGIVNQTITNSTPAQNLSIAENINFSEGNYIWGCSAYNDATSATSSNRTFEVLYSNPVISLGEPANGSVVLQSSLNFSFNATDVNGISNVSLYINDVLNETDTSGLDGAYIFNKILPDGNYNWSVIASSIFGKKTTSSTNTFLLHTTPPTILISEPSEFVEYFILGNNQTLTYNISEQGKNITEHLSNCTYEYNNLNISLNCTKDTATFTYVNGQNSLSIHAEDEYGFLASNSTTWVYKFLETNRTFNTIALQTGVETFKLTGVKDSSIISVGAVLNYNGTEYLSVKTGSGNDVILTSSINIPDTVGNVSFYWEITYTNSTGEYIFNTTSSTQQVSAISLIECVSPSVDGLTLNFTVYDSTNITELNSTFEATFQFHSESGTGSVFVEYLFSDLNENKSNYMFCLNSSGLNVTLDAFISYDSEDYDRREYIISDGIIGNFTQSIPLYLLLTELTDIVTVTVQDQTFDPIAGALVAIQEWNVGTNTYSTVGMLTTSSSGQGIIDLELYTTWYRAVVYLNGALTHVEDVRKLSSTSWIITVETGEDNPYDLFGSIVHGLTFDSTTNITSFVWLDTSGYTSKGCMIVQNTTSLGPVTIFNSCLTSVSGTIDYLLTGEGDYVAYGIIFLDGYSQSQIVDTLNIRLGTPEITEKVSPFGKVISFIAVGTAGLIGVSAGSAILGGILVIAVLIFLMKMGFMNIGWGFIWGIISIMIIVWALQRRKR